MKTPETIIKEYVRRLSEDEINFLNPRFNQLLFGDRADIVDLLSKDKHIDKLLASASDATQWFDLLEAIGNAVKKEYEHRFVKV